MGNCIWIDNETKITTAYNSACGKIAVYSSELNKKIENGENLSDENISEFKIMYDHLLYCSNEMIKIGQDTTNQTNLLIISIIKLLGDKLPPLEK